MTAQRFYLTKEALQRLKKEYEELKALKLSKTREGFPRVSSSAEVDAEYLSFQEELSFLEMRLATLENILKNVELIKAPSKKERDCVHLGAIVTLEDTEGKINEYMIVDSVEANPGEGKISQNSPVGKALMGHRVREKIVIISPIKVVYKIKKIKY